MYHKIKEYENCPDNYVLAKVDPGVQEDPIFDLLSKPRMTQKSVGFYLKKKKGKQRDEDCENNVSDEFMNQMSSCAFQKQLESNKGFWVDRPQLVGSVLAELQKKYYVEIPKKDVKGPAIFSRPEFYELEHIKKQAQKELLKADEEFESDEEEPKIMIYKNVKYAICDPCKKKQKKKKKIVEEAHPKDLIEELRYNGILPTFKKIPFGCQCDYYWEHDNCPEVWDTYHTDRVDRLRQHEMNKVMKPYKTQFLNEYYKKHPPIKFMPYEFGMKRSFPYYSTSNI